MRTDIAWLLLTDIARSVGLSRLPNLCSVLHKERPAAERPGAERPASRWDKRHGILDGRGDDEKRNAQLAKPPDGRWEPAGEVPVELLCVYNWLSGSNGIGKPWVETILPASAHPAKQLRIDQGGDSDKKRSFMWNKKPTWPRIASPVMCYPAVLPVHAHTQHLQIRMLKEDKFLKD